MIKVRANITAIETKIYKESTKQKVGYCKYK
jgi:hypothetical protein